MDPFRLPRNWTVLNHAAGASFDTDPDINEGLNSRETLLGRTWIGDPLWFNRPNTFGRRP
jgi:hypothetical protein